MGMKALTLLTVFLMAGVPRLPTFAEEAQAISVIGGTVYHDVNGNGVQDPEEEGAASAKVYLESGETRLESTADEQGRYLVSVTSGSWTLSVEAPEGWEFAPVGPVIVEVSEGASRVYEFHLGLQEAPVRDTGELLLAETPAAPEPTETASEESPTEGSGDEPGEDQENLPFLLPESGSRLPPVIAAGLLAAVGLGIGGGLLAAGRWLQRKR